MSRTATRATASSAGAERGWSHLRLRNGREAAGDAGRWARAPNKLPRLGLVILGAVVDGESSNEKEKLSPAAPEQEQRFSELRQYVPADLLDVSFPVSVRGYDRRAVDAHIRRVNRVIAELKVRSSPPAAVRHALEQAGEKVQRLLRAARAAAEEITASARLAAGEGTARAKAEADELIAKARTEAADAAAKAKAEAGRMLVEANAQAQDSLARSRAEADELQQRSQQELAALRDQAQTR